MKHRWYLILASIILFGLLSFQNPNETSAWIRINQLGYTSDGIKVAVWCGKGNEKINTFNLVDSSTGKIVYTQPSRQNFGSYGPFENTYRLNFSLYKKPGRYFLKAGNATSPVFTIGNDVYQGAADFCLQYMRQQRSGFNPY